VVLRGIWRIRKFIIRDKISGQKIGIDLFIRFQFCFGFRFERDQSGTVLEGTGFSYFDISLERSELTINKSLAFDGK
jgi:hypothetical protein